MNVPHASSEPVPAGSSRARVVLLGGASAAALGLTAVIATTVLSGKTDVPVDPAAAAAPAAPAQPAVPGQLAPGASAAPAAPAAPAPPVVAPRNPFLPLVQADLPLLPSTPPLPGGSPSPSPSLGTGGNGSASPSPTVSPSASRSPAGNRAVSGTVELHNLPRLPGATPHCGAARLVHEVRVRASGGPVTVATLSKTGTVIDSGPASRALVRFGCRFTYTVKLSSTGTTSYVFEVVRRTPYASKAATPVSPSSIAGGKGPFLRLG